MRRPALLVALLLSSALAACSGDGPPTPTPTSTTVPTPVATAPPRTVSGLFSEPRPTDIDEYRTLGAPPPPFAEWDRISTMLYDTKAHTETNLGPGQLGAFSPDSTRMAWIAKQAGGIGDGDAMVIDLRTMEQRPLGATGFLVNFEDNDRVRVAQTGTGNRAVEIDLRTGERTDIVDQSPFPSSVIARSTLFELKDERQTGGFGITLVERATGAPLLKLDASIAVIADDATLAVATPFVFTGEADKYGQQYGTSNIFLVDIASGAATFIATTGARPASLPFDADERYVIWTDDPCGSPGGRTRMYDRMTQKLIELDRSLYPQLTPQGLILDGSFGGNALIDPETLQYIATIPRGDNAWSPDYAYASKGTWYGHGGTCP